MRRPGTKCGAKNCDEKLIRVNRAIVCPRCDHVVEWPNVKRGDAEIEHR